MTKAQFLKLVDKTAQAVKDTHADQDVIACVLGDAACATALRHSIFGAGGPVKAERLAAALDAFDCDGTRGRAPGMLFSGGA